jgi:anti-sigma regulatory factor (Ser/Thr protein kinase)
MPTTPSLILQLQSNPLYLSGAREMVSNVARRLGFAEDACSQMALAVDEALCNVIRHGYDKAADKPIWLTVYALGHVSTPDELARGGANEVSGIKIVIEDEARQVDLTKIKSRDLDDIRPGGLGVHIIREVMDEVHYEHRQPAGMRLTMVKKRSVPAACAADAVKDKPHG